jgi:hypothetical protein
MAPRLVAQPRAPTLGTNGGAQAAHAGMAGSIVTAPPLALTDAGQPPTKRRRLSKAQRLQNRLQQLAPAGPEHRGDKGKAAGKGKPAGASKKGKGARKGTAHAHPAAGQPEPTRGGGKGAWCVRHIEGNCQHGDRCWHRHE